MWSGSRHNLQKREKPISCSGLLSLLKTKITFETPFILPFVSEFLDLIDFCFLTNSFLSSSEFSHSNKLCSTVSDFEDVYLCKIKYFSALCDLISVWMLFFPYFCFFLLGVEIKCYTEDNVLFI